MNEKELRKQRNWEYAFYMMLTSYFFKSRCATPIWEERLFLYYQDMRVNDQYTLEERCIFFIEEQVLPSIPESFFAEPVRVKLIGGASDGITKMLFETGRDALVITTRYKGGNQKFYLCRKEVV